MTPEELLAAVSERAIGAKSITVEVALTSTGIRRYSACVFAHGNCPRGTPMAAHATYLPTGEEAIAKIVEDLADPGCKHTDCLRERVAGAATS